MENEVIKQIKFTFKDGSEWIFEGVCCTIVGSEAQRLYCALTTHGQINYLQLGVILETAKIPYDLTFAAVKIPNIIFL